MTTRRAADELANYQRAGNLSIRSALELLKPEKEPEYENVKTLPMGNKTQMRPMGHKRRRVNATYCPICGGWVEVRLQPVRLRCTGCGLEARP